MSLESSGLHAETIRGNMDQKAETVTVKGGERADSGLFGYMCITLLAKMCTISRAEQGLHNSVEVVNEFRKRGTNRDRESLMRASPTSTKVPQVFFLTQM